MEPLGAVGTRFVFDVGLGFGFGFSFSFGRVFGFGFGFAFALAFASVFALASAFVFAVDFALSSIGGGGGAGDSAGTLDPGFAFGAEVGIGCDSSFAGSYLFGDAIGTVLGLGRFFGEPDVAIAWPAVSVVPKDVVVPRTGADAQRPSGGVENCVAVARSS